MLLGHVTFFDHYNSVMLPIQIQSFLVILTILYSTCILQFSVELFQRQIFHCVTTITKSPFERSCCCVDEEGNYSVKHASLIKVFFKLHQLKLELRMEQFKVQCLFFQLSRVSIQSVQLTHNKIDCQAQIKEKLQKPNIQFHLVYNLLFRPRFSNHK